MCSSIAWVCELTLFSDVQLNCSVVSFIILMSLQSSLNWLSYCHLSVKEKAKGTIFNTVNLCIWLMTAGLVDNEHLLISYRCFAGHCSCMWCSTNAVFVFLAADSMTKKCSGCFCHSFVISQEWWHSLCIVRCVGRSTFHQVTELLCVMFLLCFAITVVYILYLGCDAIWSLHQTLITAYCMLTFTSIYDSHSICHFHPSQLLLSHKNLQLSE